MRSFALAVWESCERGHYSDGTEDRMSSCFLLNGETSSADVLLPLLIYLAVRRVMDFKHTAEEGPTDEISCV